MINPRIVFSALWHRLYRVFCHAKTHPHRKIKAKPSHARAEPANIANLSAQKPRYTTKDRSRHSVLGALAEQRAAQFLQDRGLTIVERNIRCPEGEVDLLCRQGALWVFVEVRYRSKAAYQKAGASINATKKKRLQKSVAFIMQQRHILKARIDAVLIDEGQDIQWIRDAISH